EASEKAIARLISSALDIIIELERLPSGKRLVKEEAQLTPDDDPLHAMQYLYRSPAALCSAAVRGPDAARAWHPGCCGAVLAAALPPWTADARSGGHADRQPAGVPGRQQ